MTTVLKVFIFLGFMIPWMTSSSAQALTLQLSAQELTAVEQGRARTAFEQTLKSLPQKMREAMTENLEVQFVAVKASADRAHLGMADYSKNKILLNREFLNPQAQDPYSNKRLLQTLAHEVAHFYDRTAKLSENAEFMALTGWRYGGNGLTQINNFQRRLPDVYMNVNLLETFPTLFEFFVFDPNFHCRAPEISRYFSLHFGLELPQNCDSRLIWYTSVSGASPTFQEIARERIWAIDYLWASEGEGVASKYGHAMIRLVVCAPSRSPGPDCYKDVQYHLVLSYSASSDTGNFASFSGLSGKYPLNLFAMPLSATIRQYNSTELRDLYAVPLRISKDQKDQLIDILYARHWNLDGDYYFTTQNCATEVDRNLQAIGLIQDEKLALNIPSELFAKILNAGLSLYPTRESLRNNPLLYFPSAQKNVDKALALVEQATGQKLKNLENYFDNVNALEIKKIVESKSQPAVLYALYYLEGIRRDRLHVRLVSDFIKKQSDQKELYLNTLKDGAGKMFSYRFAGSFLTSNSYGIPSYEEAKAVEQRMLTSLAQEIQQAQQDPAAIKLQEVLNTSFSQVRIIEQRQTWILRQANH